MGVLGVGEARGPGDGVRARGKSISGRNFGERDLASQVLEEDWRVSFLVEEESL